MLVHWLLLAALPSALADASPRLFHRVIDPASPDAPFVPRALHEPSSPINARPIKRPTILLNTRAFNAPARERHPRNIPAHVRPPTATRTLRRRVARADAEREGRRACTGVGERGRGWWGWDGWAGTGSGRCVAEYIEGHCDGECASAAVGACAYAYARTFDISTAG